MLNPTQLRTLREVLATGSFAAAGTRLGFTASAVSQQIAALERAVGLTFFERGPRSIRPTAAAQALVTRLDGALGQLAGLETEIRALAAGERGVVRIGSFPSASAALLPAALARLARSHPNLSVLLDESEPDELVSALRSATLDIALVFEYDPVPRCWPRELARTPLLEESLVLLAPRGRMAGDDDPIPLAELALETWVASREDTAGARSLERLCAGAGYTPLISYRSNDYNVVRGLVGAGLGFALVPALAHVDDARVATFTLKADGARRHVFALRRREDGSPVLDPVLDALTRAARVCARHDQRLRFEPVRQGRRPQA